MPASNLALFVLPLALFGGAVRAGMPQETAPPPARTQALSRAAEECAAAKADFEKAKEEYRTLMAQATTEHERDKAADKYPKTEVYTERMLQIAKKYAKDPAAVDCLVFVLESNHGATLVTDPVLDLLQRDHLQSPALADACKALQGSSSPKTEQFLATVLAQSPDHEAKGAACYSLAKVLLVRAGLVRRLQEVPDSGLAAMLEDAYGHEGFKALKKGNPAEITQAAEQRLEQVVTQYADVPSSRGTLGDKRRASCSSCAICSLANWRPRSRAKTSTATPSSCRTIAARSCSSTSGDSGEALAGA